VLSHPANPVIYEPYMRNAYGYVELAERKNGQIPKPADNSYIWGDALAVLDAVKPDVRIINLETSITESDEYWPDKGINYRMHPGNIGCLSAARLDCCVLANNHILDWGYAGPVETISVLHQAGIKGVGAGRDRRRSKEPAVVAVPGKGRVLIFAYASGTCLFPAGDGSFALAWD
jgi:poly-gamma-glutamate synthesis protein (capsule biosynthesis protein)